MNTYSITILDMDTGKKVKLHVRQIDLIRQTALPAAISDEDEVGALNRLEKASSADRRAVEVASMLSTELVDAEEVHRRFESMSIPYSENHTKITKHMGDSWMGYDHPGETHPVALAGQHLAAQDIEPGTAHQCSIAIHQTRGIAMDEPDRLEFHERLMEGPRENAPRLLRFVGGAGKHPGMLIDQHGHSTSQRINDDIDDTQLAILKARADMLQSIHGSAGTQLDGIEVPIMEVAGRTDNKGLHSVIFPVYKQPEAGCLKKDLSAERECLAAATAGSDRWELSEATEALRQANKPIRRAVHQLASGLEQVHIKGLSAGAISMQTIGVLKNQGSRHRTEYHLRIPNKRPKETSDAKEVQDLAAALYEMITGEAPLAGNAAGGDFGPREENMKQLQLAGLSEEQAVAIAYTLDLDPGEKPDITALKNAFAG